MKFNNGNKRVIDLEIQTLNKELENPTYKFPLYSSYLRAIRDNYISLKSIINTEEEHHENL